MENNSISTVIGVFYENSQADSAIDELRHAGFGYDRIRLVEHGTGSLVDTLKGMFTGQASTTSSAADNLIKMGMPDYEAQHYQHELDADHVLLLMNAGDHPENAFSIMRQNGAFDINSRLRIASENGADETPSPTTSANAPYTDTSSVPQNAPASPPTSYKDRSQWVANPDGQSLAAVPPASAPSPHTDEYTTDPEAVNPSTAPESRM